MLRNWREPQIFFGPTFASLTTGKREGEAFASKIFVNYRFSPSENPLRVEFSRLLVVVDAFLWINIRHGGEHNVKRFGRLDRTIERLQATIGTYGENLMRKGKGNAHFLICFRTPGHSQASMFLQISVLF